MNIDSSLVAYIAYENPALLLYAVIVLVNVVYIKTASLCSRIF